MEHGGKGWTCKGLWRASMGVYGNRKTRIGKLTKVLSWYLSSFLWSSSSRKLLVKEVQTDRWIPQLENKAAHKEAVRQSPSPTLNYDTSLSKVRKIGEFSNLRLKHKDVIWRGALCLFLSSLWVGRLLVCCVWPNCHTWDLISSTTHIWLPGGMGFIFSKYQTFTLNSHH